MPLKCLTCEFKETSKQLPFFFLPVVVVWVCLFVWFFFCLGWFFFFVL